MRKMSYKITDGNEVQKIENWDEMIALDAMGFRAEEVA
jgi:hypothetical protein